MKKILILFYFITGVLYAQSFQLGLRSESTVFNTTQYGTVFVPLYHFFITAGLYEENTPLLNDLTEEIRFGRIIDPDYMAGNDLIFALKSHIIKNSFYITVGINMHSNLGLSDDPHIHARGAVYFKRIYMLLLGIGFNANKNIFIEISTYIPISNPALGENDSYNFIPPDYNEYNFLREQWKLNYLIAINLGFTLDVFHFK